MKSLPKLLTFTRGVEQLRGLTPWIDYLYYRGLVDGMSIVATSAEMASGASHFIHRFLEEFSITGAFPERPEWLEAAAQRALREERPAILLLPHDPDSTESLIRTAQVLGVDVLQLDRTAYLHCAAGRLVGVEDLEAWLSARSIETPIRSVTTFEMPAGPLRGRLALADDPQSTLRELLAEPGPLRLLEPVNLLMREGGATFRYGDYDNEFALGPASHDLRALLHGQARVEVVAPRSGAALGSDWECPDAVAPCFLIQTGQSPKADWLSRFPLSGRTHRIVVADSQNIAGSVLNHCLAINRYTSWRATALCSQPHPFIDYPQEECRVHFAGGGMTPHLRQTLEQAEVFLFFEDDDERSPSWPFDLTPFVEGKPILHLYIGQRVHRNVEAGQRPGRKVLTPLPHLLRMFPQAHFYAGFPPTTLDEVELKPPRSQRDGVARVLHTPSLPHETTHRYYYHKDTEAFLEAAQSLRRPGVEFWQLAGMAHAQILQARLDCDITFNQLRGFHGLSGDEAMYLERPMVQAFDQHNINRHREYWGLDADFPWLDARPGNLAEVLNGLLEDPEGRVEIGRRSRQFMLEYFSPQRGIVPLIYHCERALEERNGLRP